jgi:hypothetical protein
MYNAEHQTDHSETFCFCYMKIRNTVEIYSPSAAAFGGGIISSMAGSQWVGLLVKRASPPPPTEQKNSCREKKRTGRKNLLPSGGQAKKV